MEPLSGPLNLLCEFLRFPSVSTDPSRAGAVSACAQWLAGHLAEIGLLSEVHPTPGHPVVVARNLHKLGRPTVLIYGHYDVQPEDPVELWQSAPFEPEIRNGVLFARGSADNKGQIFAHIQGVAQALKNKGEIPVNLIFLVEGEEEIGSPHLEGFLKAHREALRCDIIAVSDTSMVAAGVPTLTYGLRGIAAMEIRVKGPSMDLHSGIYGGAVRNPAVVLAHLLASLHRSDGRVAVEGFYDAVLPLEDWEREAWAGIPFGERQIEANTGAPALGGEVEFTALERIWGRPTAEVNGIGGGFQGEGTKTIIPKEVFAKLTFRLVPDQAPEFVLAAVERHLRAVCPAGVTLEVLPGHSGETYVTDPHSPCGRAAQEALRRVFPGRQVALTREGGSIPIVNTFQRVLGVETLLLGLALPDCRAHAPNENFPVANFEAGILLNQTLLEELSRVNLF
ncbi:MAG: Acetylornithine deacetylase/Succinyl-diaminopimelate desuccinylase [Verrucomicrobia bacterium]|nr:MAG: Acetylornithine deacetylase/Succinyl-diaminopimelate desuccinylase [Verrucomicrobiota bacterium]